MRPTRAAMCTTSRFCRCNESQMKVVQMIPLQNPSMVPRRLDMGAAPISPMYRIFEAVSYPAPGGADGVNSQESAA